KHFKLDILIPMTISFYGVMLLTINPVKLAFDKKVAEISYMDGKGLLVGIAVAIITVEVYRIFKEKKIGVIKMPPSVPPSLTET
ncbi:PTS sugar transporter subunit IIC, partial [Alkalihalophilus pseudofirmus]|nr:PTS sugar transporter subunit IIC [Alkalihalophilus pseudofirmus]